jgi:type IV pilus assembly protein PilA
MTCPHCAENPPEGSQFCSMCGNRIAITAAASPFPPVGAPQTSGKAIASLICGLFAWLFPASLAAVILGHMSRSEIRKSAGRIQGDGMAIAGLILGYLGIAFIPFILIIAAIAIPNLLRAREAANEASAVGSLRSYTTAMMGYAAQCPQNGFPRTAEKLGGQPSAADDCDHAGLVDSILASEEPIQHGYRFHYQPGAIDDQGRVTAYTITADPVVQGSTGIRHFFVDATGVIRFEAGRIASVQSPALQ